MLNHQAEMWRKQTKRELKVLKRVVLHMLLLKFSKSTQNIIFELDIDKND